MAKRKKLSLAEALELLEKPAHKGSEGQSTSKKDTREGKMGEKPAKKKAKLSLAEALELLEKPTGEGHEERTSRKENPREGKMGENPASKKGKVAEGGIEGGCNQLGRGMAKRKGSPASRESASSQREGEAKISKGDVEDECDQIRCAIHALKWKRPALETKERELKAIIKAKNKLEVRRKKLEMSKSNLKKTWVSGRIGDLKEQEHRLEGKRHRLDNQLTPLRLEVEQLQSFLPKRKRLEDGCNELEVENAQRLLGTLPKELWEKIFDNLENNDLFPLALSCRFFRQKQKELVARTRQSGPRSEKRVLTLKTSLWQRLTLSIDDEDRPASAMSAEYLRFCSKEKASWDVEESKAYYIRRLAAFHGYLPLLQELLKPSKTLPKRTITLVGLEAAKGGQLETLQWLRSEGYRLDESDCLHAARCGQLEVLKWLRSEGCPWDRWACIQAARRGHLEVLKWLRSEGCPLDRMACSCAAEHGHLEVLKWLRSEGCPWGEVSCRFAAEHGQLEVLRWLRSEGFPWDERACRDAAKGGHLEILKWLRSEGCPWNKEACNWAAKNGHLETLKWLRREGCPWDEETCCEAAERGHLEVLQWLRSEGCPWDLGKCRWLAEGHMDIFSPQELRVACWKVLRWLRSLEN